MAENSASQPVGREWLYLEPIQWPEGFIDMRLSGLVASSDVTSQVTTVYSGVLMFSL